MYASPALSDLPKVAPATPHVQPRSEPSPAPLLLLFTSATSGAGQRVDGFIAHALQRRGNHVSFRYRQVLQEERPDLFERFAVLDVPTILVIDRQRVQCRLTGLVRPRALEVALADWLY